MLGLDAEHGNPFVERFVGWVVTFRPFVRGDNPVINLLIYIQYKPVKLSGISSQGMLNLPTQIHPY